MEVISIGMAVVMVMVMVTVLVLVNVIAMMTATVITLVAKAAMAVVVRKCVDGVVGGFGNHGQYGVPYFICQVGCPSTIIRDKFFPFIIIRNCCHF